MNQHIPPDPTGSAEPAVQLDAGLLKRASLVAAVAAAHAADVDFNSRLPHEALDELKKQKLLGIQVPASLGGEGAALGQIAEVCSVIARECASSAMLYAMHNIKLASVVTFGQQDNWHRQFMQRVAAEQLLLASATTEAGVGGDVRSSVCAIIPGIPDAENFNLEKNGTVISYGRYADAILITARRTQDSVNADQVLATLLRGQYTLEQTSSWDTMGMRGTCSEGHTVKAKASRAQILPTPFADIAARSMLPSSHILWSGVWHGLAAGALIKAQNLLRADMKARPNFTPPGMSKLAQAASLVQTIRSTLTSAIQTYEAFRLAPAGQSDGRLGIVMNNLKLYVSQTAIEVIMLAMQIGGIRAYRNDTPFSMGRMLRDALSAPIMINNDRIEMNTANLLLVHRESGRLLEK